MCNLCTCLGSGSVGWWGGICPGGNLECIMLPLRSMIPQRAIGMRLEIHFKKLPFSKASESFLPVKSSSGV